MDNLTLKEKRVIFNILILIMKADNIIMPTEQEFLDKVFVDFQLDLSEFDHTEMLDFDYLKKEFSSFPEDVKTFGKQLFIQMAAVDGFVDPRESEIINNL